MDAVLRCAVSYVDAPGDLPCHCVHFVEGSRPMGAGRQESLSVGIAAQCEHLPEVRGGVRKLVGLYHLALRGNLSCRCTAYHIYHTAYQ